MRLEIEDDREAMQLLSILLAAAARPEEDREAAPLPGLDRVLEAVRRNDIADPAAAAFAARRFQAPPGEMVGRVAAFLAGRHARGLVPDTGPAEEARRACLPHAATLERVARPVGIARDAASPRPSPSPDGRFGSGDAISGDRPSGSSTCGDPSDAGKAPGIDRPSAPRATGPSRAGDDGGPRGDGPPDRPGARPAAPGLTLVSVPIGDARDVTLRALDVLASAEVLAAEDTRSLRRLMAIHGVALGGRPLMAYHDHNGARMRPRLLRELAEGRSLAYASEAGTPLVADPGYALVRAAIEAGHPVTAAPGPSAALAALAVGGLPSDRFLFAGFPPPAAGARRRWLEGLDAAGATVALYESPRRVHRLLGEMAEVFGPDRPAALCRELTKRFEEVLRGTLGDLAEAVSGRAIRGEVVVLLGRAAPAEAGEDALDGALRAALARLSLRDAVAEVARETGLPRRRVYRAALAMEGGDDEEADDG